MINNEEANDGDGGGRTKRDSSQINLTTGSIIEIAAPTDWDKRHDIARVMAKIKTLTQTESREAGMVCRNELPAGEYCIAASIRMLLTLFSQIYKYVALAVEVRSAGRGTIRIRGQNPGEGIAIVVTDCGSSFQLGACDKLLTSQMAAANNAECGVKSSQDIWFKLAGLISH